MAYEGIEKLSKKVKEDNKIEIKYTGESNLVSVKDNVITFKCPSKIRLYPGQTVLIDLKSSIKLPKNYVIITSITQQLALRTKIRCITTFITNKVEFVVSNYGKDKVILHKDEELVIGLLNKIEEFTWSEGD